MRLKCLERSFSRPSRQAKSREHPPKEVIPLLLSRARVPTLSNRSKMTLDYGSETPLRELVSPPSLLSAAPTEKDSLSTSSGLRAFYWLIMKRIV